MSIGSGRNMWTEVQKIKRKAKVQTGLVHHVDGVSTKAGIGELFARKFESVCSSKNR